MHIEKIAYELGLGPELSYLQILGGADSSVWKIQSQGNSYALRILPPSGHEQFLQEQEVIEFARENGVPVPRVFSVHLGEDYAAMLMEWGSGKPIFEELLEQPENARFLGNEFGRILATIHSIMIPASFNKNGRDWLTPVTHQESELVKRIKEEVSPPQNVVLLHLDYHPLNVLTDGDKITAVIDWANATVGDSRFDIARTYSILKLEGAKHFDRHSHVLEDFLKGWLDGYSDTMGSFPSLPLFNAWAGVRMERDLAGKRSEADFVNVRQWICEWLKKS